MKLEKNPPNTTKKLTIILITLLMLSGCLEEPAPQPVRTDEIYELRTLDNAYCEPTKCPTTYPNHTCFYCQKNPAREE